MTNEDNKGARSLRPNVFAAGLLAVMLFAAASWPVQEFAQQPRGAVAGSFETPPMNFAALSRPSFPHPLLLAPSAPTSHLGRLDFNGSLARTDAGGRGSVAGKLSFAPFDAHRLIVYPSGAGPASGGNAGKKPIGKGGLALGIVGAGVAALGVVLMAGSGSHSTCANQLLSNVCNDAHTAGEVMVPAGAALAVTGFYLAFRHRQ